MSSVTVNKPILSVNRAWILFGAIFLIAANHLPGWAQNVEIWRAQATGTTAAIFGPRAVKRDHGTRLFQFRGDMTQEVNHYHPHELRLELDDAIDRESLLKHDLCGHPELG
jgi:acyl-homoserine lactone acylase PvdQ